VFGSSRQGYYKHEQLLKQRFIQAGQVMDIVKDIRAIMPRIGCRKMHGEVNRQLLLRSIKPIGRDRFFEILRERDQLIMRKRRTVFTTDSYHRFRTYKNRLKNTVIAKPNQAWVADITYLRIKNDFCYLFLLTDDCSRKIVGYSVSKDLSVKGALKALAMASKQAKGVEDIC
jgi:transposase InsO family protein